MAVIFMTRRKNSLQKVAMRGMVSEYLKNHDISIKNGTKDTQKLMYNTSIGRIRKSALPFSKHLQILCQFLKFTQNLKRSRENRNYKKNMTSFSY